MLSFHELCSTERRASEAWGVAALVRSMRLFQDPGETFPASSSCWWTRFQARELTLRVSLFLGAAGSVEEEVTLHKQNVTS